MWILFNIIPGGKIRKAKVIDYLAIMCYPTLEVPPNQINDIFDLFDFSKNGYLDRKGLECFLEVLMIMQPNLSFKTSEIFLEKLSEEEHRQQKLRE